MLVISYVGAGTAWEIAKDENTSYMYYRGYADNGSFTDNNPDFELLYTIDDVYEKLEEHNWNIDLNWYQ